MEQSTTSGCLNLFGNQLATWFVGVIIALLGVFSSKLVECAKFALNKAELRSKNYEEFSTDLSEFVFAAELNKEFLEKNWTTRDTLVDLATTYNNSITKLRKKDYVYLSWIKRYWGSDSATLYLQTFDTIREYDQAIHSLNDEFEAVNIKKTQEKVSPDRAAAAATAMNAIVQKLRNQTDELLTKLL